MAKVTKGMEKAEVVRFLGNPEDVRTANEMKGRINLITSEIWCWGTSGHLTTATLGSVHFDAHHKVLLVCGSAGQPPNPLPVPESKLRALMQILDQVPSYANWQSFDPRRLIHAVNSLQPLGRARAIAVMREYLRVTYRLHRPDGPDGIFLVLRALFDVPTVPGHLPRMNVGYSKEEPGDPAIFPRFPLALIEDIPVLLSEGYSGGGGEEPVEKHLSYFEERGILREAPLQPSTEPFRLLQALQESVSRIDPSDKRRPDVRFACGQLLTLLDTVFRPERVPNDDAMFRLGEALRPLDVRWDPQRSRYTFQDGSVLQAGR